MAYGRFLHRRGRPEEAEATLRSAVELAPKEAAPELALARFYLRLGKRSDAQKHFATALEKQPDDARAVLDYAKFLFTEESFAEAAKLFEKLLGNDEFQVEAREGLAEVQLALGKDDEAGKQLDQIPEKEARRRPRCLSVRGRLLMRKGKPWEAITTLERCVRAAPHFAEGYMFLGAALSSVGEQGTALACFRGACARAPGNQHYQLQLARSEFVLGHYGSAIQRCRLLAAEATNPETKADASLLLAQAYAVLRDTDNASQAVRAAAKLVQDDVAQLIRLAALYISQKDFARAEELLRGFIAEHRDSVTAVTVLAQTLVLQKKAAEAQKLLEGFVAEHKDSLPAISALAQVYLLQDKSREAEQVLQGAIKTSPEPLAPTIQYARLCMARGDKESAKVSLRGLLEAAPGRLDYQRAMAGFYVATGEMDQALKTYQDAEKNNPDDVAVKLAVLAVLLNQKRFDEAEARVKEIENLEPHSTRSLLARPRLLLAKRELKGAISALSNVVKRRPHEPASHQLLGRAYASSGDLSSAVQHLKQAVSISPRSTTARLLLAEAYYRSKLFALAIGETQGILRANPSSQPAHLLAAYSLTAERAVEEAIQEWNAALELGEGRVTHYIALGRLHLEQDDLDKAEEAFRKAHELSPKSPVVIQALAHLYRIREKPAQAEALLKELVKANPKDPIGRLLLGNHYHATRNLEAAEKEFSEAIAVSPKSPGCYVVLGNFYFVTGKTDEAIARYRRAMELSDDPADARILLVRALVAARRLEEAEELIAAALKADPNDYRALVQNAQLMLPLAYHHRDESAVQEAIHLCQRALQERPDYAEAHYVTGKAHLSRIPPQLLPAESEFRRALQITPHDIRFRIDRAKVLFLLGRHKDAEEEAREVLRTQPSDLAALVVLADATLASSEEKAESIAQTLAREFPKNPACEFLLGRTHHRNRKFEDALPHYQRALAHEKHAFLILDGLVGCSLSLEKPDQAVAFCEEFIKHNPRSVLAHEMLGNVYLKGERFADAEKALRRAALLNPASLDPVIALLAVYRQQKKPELALEACRSYVRRWPNNPAGHVLLGRLLAARKHTDDARASFAKALELNPRSFRALSLLVNTHLLANNPEAAITRCQDFIKHNPGSALAYGLLGDVYRAEKDGAKAAEYLRKASALAPRFVAPHLLLADMNMSQGNYDLAVKNYEDVLDISPANTVALNNAAYLLAEQGRDLDRASTLAGNLVSRFPEDADALDTYGWVSFKRGDTDAAIAAFQKSLKLRQDSPSTLYHLAAALLKKGSRQEARAVLERALASEKPFRELAQTRELLEEARRQP